MAGDFAVIKFTLDEGALGSMESRLDSLIEKYTGKEFKIKFSADMDGARENLGNFKKQVGNLQKSLEKKPLDFAGDLKSTQRSLHDLSEVLAPLNKALTTEGTGFQELAKSGGVSFSNLISQLERIVSLTEQIGAKEFTNITQVMPSGMEGVSAALDDVLAFGSAIRSTFNDLGSLYNLMQRTPSINTPEARDAWTNAVKASQKFDWTDITKRISNIKTIGGARGLLAELDQIAEPLRRLQAVMGSLAGDKIRFPDLKLPNIGANVKAEAEALQQELTAMQQGNSAAEQHSQAMESAVEAEAAKMRQSKELAKTLQAEEKAMDAAGNAAEEHGEKQERKLTVDAPEYSKAELRQYAREEEAYYKQEQQAKAKAEQAAEKEHTAYLRRQAASEAQAEKERAAASKREADAYFNRIDEKEAIAKANQAAIDRAMKRQEAVAKQTMKQQEAAVKQAANEQEALRKEQLSTLSKAEDYIGKGQKSFKNLTDRTKSVNEYTQAFQKLQSLLHDFSGVDLDDVTKPFEGDQAEKIRQIARALDEVKEKAGAASAESKSVTDGLSRGLAFDKLENRMQQFWSRYGESIQRSSEDTKKFRKQLAQVQSGKGNITELNDQWIQYENTIHAAGLDHKSLLQTLTSGFAGKLMYGALAEGAMNLRQSMEQMVVNVRDIDSAMTQLQIVTQGSGADMANYFDRASESARKLGVSIVDLTDSATTFSRLGYSADESRQLAEYTAMLTKVGDIDTATATDAVTAIVKAFDMDVGDVQGVMDKMVEVGNNFPVSVSDLAEGMNNAGSALHAAGNTFEESVSLLTAANTTVQDIDKSSTALRTMAARIRRTETDIEGEEAVTDSKYNAMVEALSKYQVSLTDINGEYRSTYDIINDISEVWDKMSSMEQSALAETIAGTRNQNVFFSLVEQFQEARGAMESMLDSDGAMSTAYDVYLDSIEGKIGQLKASFETLSFDFIGSGTVGVVVDMANGIVGLADGLAKVNMLLPSVAAGFVAFKAVSGPKRTGSCCAHISLAREGSYPVEPGRSEPAA